MRRLEIFNAIFFAAGIVGLGVSSWLATGTLHLQQNGLTANGHVIRFERDSKGYYFPVVEFQTPDGQRIMFKSRSGSSPPSFHVGESVPVLYDPDDPQQASIRTFGQLWGGALITGIFAVVLTVIPGGVIVAQMRKRRRVGWLKQFGQRVPAQFDRVEQIRSIQVNRRSPYRIYARGLNPFMSQEQVFQSEYLWSDPTPYVGDRPLEVLIDSNNPKRYWLDTGFIQSPGQ